MLNQTTFNEGMGLLCETFGREATVLLLKAYYAVLGRLTDAEFQISVVKVLESKTFNKLPLPAEILEMTQGKKQDQAILALANLEKGIARIGRYRSAQFEDPIIMACVESMGGWIQVCSYEMREWEFKRKDFLRLYEAFLANPDRVQAPSRLVGYAEQTNDFMCTPGQIEVKKFTTNNSMVDGDPEQKSIGYTSAEPVGKLLKLASK